MKEWDLPCYSLGYAEEILQHERYEAIYQELMVICHEVPIPIFPGKSSKQPRLDVVQQLMNRYFQQAFTEFGWECEPHATTVESADHLRSDFRKTFRDSRRRALTVQVEVEFGNSASLYRDWHKFHASYHQHLVDICILIVPLQILAKRIDSGIASFEKVIREMPNLERSGVYPPTLVIGLNPNFLTEWQLEPSVVELDRAKNDSFYQDELLVEWIETVQWGNSLGRIERY